MKQFQITGNLGRDVDAKYTPQGKMVANASVAVNSGYGENKTTEWVKLVLWEKSAELFNKMAKKGTKVWVSGTPKLSVWLSKSGDPQAQIELTVREFEILKDGAPREESSDNPYDAELSDLPDPQD